MKKILEVSLFLFTVQFWGLGCGGPVDDASVIVLKEPLLQRGVPFTNGLVKVCWEVLANNNQFNARSTPNFDTLAAWTQDEVENKWGRVWLS